MPDMTLTKVLRSAGLAERATVHGFRSTFRDWAAERTNAPHAVMEAEPGSFDGIVGWSKPMRDRT